MSEQLRPNAEHGERHEVIDASAEARENLERIHSKAEKAEHDPLQKHIESLQASVESQAISGKEISGADTAAEQTTQSFGISKELKADTYKHTLKRIRSHLKTPEKAFSKIIHQPVIERTSNGLSKTVARPSAFLGGSFFALLGSAVLLYMSRHYGFTYNYAAIFAVFAVGFAVGLILELLYKLLTRKRSA